MLKKMIAEAGQYAKENPLLLFYSLCGMAIFTFISSVTNFFLNGSFVYAFLLGLPLCLGSDYLVADRTLPRKWMAPAVFTTFGVGFAIAYFLPSFKSFQVHLFATTCLLFLLIPKAVRQDEKIGFHWTIHVLYSIGLSLTTSGILLGLVAFLAWAIEELFNFKFPKVLDHFGLSFFLVFLSINLFAFLKPEPASVKTLRYDLTNAVEKTIKVLFTPVMLIYVVVLLLYTIKILIDLQLPRGMVIMPISIAYATFFILDAYIGSQNRVVEGVWKYRNWIQLSFIPLFIVMGIGIFVRVEEYGLTTDRVYLLMIYLFMLLTLIVRWSWRALELRRFIATGAALLLITSAGPLNPTHLMIQSQTNHFLKVIKKYGREYPSLEEFKLSTWTLQDITSAHSSLSLILSNDGEKTLERAGVDDGLFIKDAELGKVSLPFSDLLSRLSSLDTSRPYDQKKKADQRVCQSINVPWNKRADSRRISGYDWLLKINDLRGKNKIDLKIPESNEHFEIDLLSYSLSMTNPTGRHELIHFEKPIRDAVLTSSAGLINNPLVLHGQFKKHRVQMTIWEANLDCDSQSLEGELLIKQQ